MGKVTLHNEPHEPTDFREAMDRMMWDNAPLSLFGDTPDEARLQRMADALGIEGDVHVYPYLRVLVAAVGRTRPAEDGSHFIVQYDVQLHDDPGHDYARALAGDGGDPTEFTLSFVLWHEFSHVMHMERLARETGRTVMQVFEAGSDVQTAAERVSYDAYKAVDTERFADGIAREHASQRLVASAPAWAHNAMLQGRGREYVKLGELLGAVKASHHAAVEAGDTADSLWSLWYARQLREQGVHVFSWQLVAAADEHAALMNAGHATQDEWPWHYAITLLRSGVSVQHTEHV